MKKKTSISHDKALVKELKADPEYAAEYLKAAMDDYAEPKVLLIALRQLTESYGGMSKIAKVAGIERESLYRALSERGNPRFSTIQSVLNAMGLKLTVQPSYA